MKFRNLPMKIIGIVVLVLILSQVVFGYLAYQRSQNTIRPTRVEATIVSYTPVEGKEYHFDLEIEFTFKGEAKKDNITKHLYGGMYNGRVITIYVNDDGTINLTYDPNDSPEINPMMILPATLFSLVPILGMYFTVRRFVSVGNRNNTNTDPNTYIPNHNKKDEEEEDLFADFYNKED